MTRRSEPLELTVKNLLDFEARYPQGAAAKASHIRDTFDVHPARYQQALSNALLAREALEHDPMLTRLLIEQRTDRARDRASRVFRSARPGSAH